MVYNTITNWLRLSRFDNPSPFWLITLPTFWGLTMAHQQFPPIMDLVIFLTGSILMRGAGCTINDIMDRKLDCQVERTASRPLAAKQISVQSAIVWFVVQLLFGAALLLIMNKKVLIMSVIALFMMIIYPLMKRITYWPQIFLGIAWNYPMLMAYVYVQHTLTTDIMVLYVGAILWTIAYDTIYAHQDKEDDIKAGVKSSALFLQEKTKIFVIACYTLFALTLTYVISLNLFSLISIILFIALLYKQIISLDINNPKSCGYLFKSNKWVGLCVWLTLLLSHVNFIAN